MLTELEIINRGKIKNVVLILDDGEIHYSSDHWANSSGKRMYSLSRVEIAESLINNLENGIYYHKDADEINKMILPVVNQVYHLYEKDDHYKLSIIGKNEWGRSKPLGKYIATVKLLGDHSWDVIERAEKSSFE